MTNYSRQLDKFIESKPYASSYYKKTDCRTWVRYYQDVNGLIHSSSFNYSILGAIPATPEQFLKLMERDTETKVVFS